jgi:hypothetical protein
VSNAEIAAVIAILNGRNPPYTEVLGEPGDTAGRPVCDLPEPLESFESWFFAAYQAVEAAEVPGDSDGIRRPRSRLPGPAPGGGTPGL